MARELALDLVEDVASSVQRDHCRTRLSHDAPRIVQMFFFNLS